MNLRVFYLTRRGISDGYGFPIRPAWDAYIRNTPQKRFSLIHVRVNQADFLRDMRMINDVHSCGERYRAWRS